VDKFTTAIVAAAAQKKNGHQQGHHAIRNEAADRETQRSRRASSVNCVPQNASSAPNEAIARPQQKPVALPSPRRPLTGQGYYAGFFLLVRFPVA
jgi:hypothetical protein